MSYSSVQSGYARFVDGKWEPIITTSTVGVKTLEIGGNSPMPVYLYAALVTNLGLFMREPTLATLWQKFPYETYCREIEIIGKDLP